MPQAYKVRTLARTIPIRHRDDPERTVVMVVDLLPRGTGNRNYARRLADAFATHEKLAPHIVKATPGASKVTVHFRPSIEFMGTIYGMMLKQSQDGEAATDPEQMLLSL
jgi:hypothetical protein